ncbi:MAG TPA: hypothetical protein VHK05_03590 [Candidatus Limnocylindrales bacterium]|jgi:hypothetical protein|nr:hypothetical protein [Candidatus Limnocylindrales bacterium]
MDDLGRWLVAVVAAAAIIGLIAFARGEPGRGETVQTATARVGLFAG